MREIPVTDVGPIFIGQTEDSKAATGCTVLIAPQGMHAGLDVRGGGPASRETFLLNPLTAAQSIHAIVLAGGSAFGLGAANGVMEYLEEHDIGFDVGITKVPLVVQSDIFDLTVGDMKVRPDAEMGYAAAKAAFEAPNYRDGNYGGGTGATVGKACGMEYCMKTGIGSHAIQIGELYRARWQVEISFRILKGFCSLKKCNTRKSGIVQALIYLSQIVYLLKLISGQQLQKAADTTFSPKKLVNRIKCHFMDIKELALDSAERLKSYIERHLELFKTYTKSAPSFTNRMRGKSIRHIIEVVSKTPRMPKNA